MCTQTTGLVAAEIERRGIPTVAIQLLREVAEKVRPPRGLVVPFPHGYPLGRPGDAALQRRVLERMLEVAEGEEGPGPVLVELGPAARPDP